MTADEIRGIKQPSSYMDRTQLAMTDSLMLAEQTAQLAEMNETLRTIAQHLAGIDEVLKERLATDPA